MEKVESPFIRTYALDNLDLLYYDAFTFQTFKIFYGDQLYWRFTSSEV